MKPTLLISFLSIASCSTLLAGPASFVPLMEDTNGALVGGDTNFFLINSNKLNASVNNTHGAGSGPGIYFTTNFSTNGASQIALAGALNKIANPDPSYDWTWVFYDANGNLWITNYDASDHLGGSSIQFDNQDQGDIIFQAGQFVNGGGNIYFNGGLISSGQIRLNHALTQAGEALSGVNDVGDAADAITWQGTDYKSGQPCFTFALTGGDGSTMSLMPRSLFVIAQTNYSATLYDQEIICRPTNGSMNVILPGPLQTASGFKWAWRGLAAGGGGLDMAGGTAEWSQNTRYLTVHDYGSNLANTVSIFDTNHDWIYCGPFKTTNLVLRGGASVHIISDGTNLFASGGAQCLQSGPAGPLDASLQTNLNASQLAGTIATAVQKNISYVSSVLPLGTVNYWLASDPSGAILGESSIPGAALSGSIPLSTLPSAALTNNQSSPVTLNNSLVASNSIAITNRSLPAVLAFDATNHQGSSIQTWQNGSEFWEVDATDLGWWLLDARTGNSTFSVNNTDDAWVHGQLTVSSNATFASSLFVTNAATGASALLSTNGNLHSQTNWHSETHATNNAYVGGAQYVNSLIVSNAISGNGSGITNKPSSQFGYTQSFANGTRFYPLGFSTSGQGAVAVADQLVTQDGPASTLRFHSSAAIGAGTNITITLEDGDADTAVACTLTGNGSLADASDLAHSATVHAGDKFCVKIISNSAVSAALSWSFLAP